MRLIDADALWHNMETADWYNNADRDEVAEPLILRSSTIGGWISVKDRLPDKQPCEYLVVNANNVETSICLDNRWITPRRVIKITHWMPLPEPPKEVKQDG